MARTPDPVRIAAGRIAHWTQRCDHPDAPAQLAEARRALAVAHLHRAVGEAIAAVPPLTREERETAARLLVSGGAQ